MIDKDNQALCPAPWVGLYVEPTGRVDNCCVGKNNLGNIQENTIEELLYGDINLSVQQTMLAGEYPKGCAWCENSSHSLQKLLFQFFPDRSESNYQPGTFKLQYLDARWSNTCNFACVYCSPAHSSVWAQEVNVPIKVDRQHKNELLEYALTQVENLKEVYLAGGEPLMMKENEIFLQQLIEKNPGCHICVNTNLSQIENNQIFDFLIKGENVQWLVSVEDMHERYEYLRYPGKWETFDHNLKILKQKYKRNVDFNMVFVSLNALTIWDTIDYLESQGHHLAGITLALYDNGMSNGDWDVKLMPRSFQDLVIKRMDHSKYRNIIGWQNIFDYLNSDLIKESGNPWEAMNALDQRRGLDSHRVFPLVYEYKDTK